MLVKRNDKTRENRRFSWRHRNVILSGLSKSRLKCLNIMSWIQYRSTLLLTHENFLAICLYITFVLPFFVIHILLVIIATTDLALR